MDSKIPRTPPETPPHPPEGPLVNPPTSPLPPQPAQPEEFPQKITLAIPPLAPAAAEALRAANEQPPEVFPPSVARILAREQVLAHERLREAMATDAAVNPLPGYLPLPYSLGDLARRHPRLRGVRERRARGLIAKRLIEDVRRAPDGNGYLITESMRQALGLPYPPE